jgi:hypothetical protein
MLYAIYSYLVQQNTSSTIDYTIPDFNPFYMYVQRSSQQPIQSKVYFIEDYVAMLLKDADKLFGELVKKLGDDVISGYTVNTSTSPSIPALSHSGEDFPPN